MQAKVTDVERLKKQVRKLVAARVLAGETADVCLDLGPMDGCQVRIAAAYGPLSKTPQALPKDQLLWILDGYAEIHDVTGEVTHASQGESIVLHRGTAYRLVFPQLTIYLRVEPAENA